MLESTLKDDYEAARELIKKDIPIPKETLKILKQKQQYFIDNNRYKIKNKWDVYADIQLYHKKLIFRIYLVYVAFDYRRKNPAIGKYIYEVFRCKEGNRIGAKRFMYLKTMMGIELKSIDLLAFNQNRLANYWDDLTIWDTCPCTFFDRFLYESSHIYPVEKIIQLKPELKYSQVKISDNPITFMGYYKKNPQIEFFRKCCFNKLTNSKRAFDRIKKGDKQFMKLLYLCYQADYTNFTYEEYASFYRNYKLQIDKFEKFHEAYTRFCNARTNVMIHSRYGYGRIDEIYKKITKLDEWIELSEYLERKRIDYCLYKDYYEMAFKAGHDMNDNYWKYPNNLNNAHDKVTKEVENINKLNIKLKYNMLHEVLKDLEQYKMSINGYEIFITSNVEIIKKQGDVLYQCLIRDDYIEKEIHQEIVLVFFWKDGKPAYTAEVSYAGKVGQFYGDERDRNTCQAPEELKEMLNEYLSSIKLKKRKCSKKVKYYKGFSNKENGKFIGYNNYEFEVGKTYNTVFSNEEITRYGGKGCNATNKVFHFCNSIEEISKHYSPKYYCEVEPLGPVLEYNGALLSNKIKIVKEIQYDQV